MCRVTLLILSLTTFAIASAVAQPVGQEEAYPLLPRDEEIALARSAGLAPWNEEATIYVLERRGYVEAKRGTNGFTCMVGRDHPGTRWPICFDPEGSETILPRYLRETKLRLEGKSPEEVRRDSAERFLDGTYRAPGRAGIAYMLSPNSITFDGKELRWTPPHLMFYAPNVKGEDVGAIRHPHSPMMLFEGDPHGYFIVFVRDDIPPLRKVEGTSEP